MENIQTKICQFDLFRRKQKISQKRNIFFVDFKVSIYYHTTQLRRYNLNENITHCDHVGRPLSTIGSLVQIFVPHA